jgi:hypothetical protein
MATTFTVSVFCLLVVLVSAVVVWGLRRAGVGPVNLLVLAALYVIVPSVLAASGRLDRYSPLPAPALILLAFLTCLTVCLTLARRGSSIASATSLGALIVLQSFRMPVEWLLHRLYSEGVVPIQMTYAGRNWDIVSGVTGLLLGAWLLSGRTVPTWLILGWNLLGLGLLLNILTIAIVSTPVPFRQFPLDPPNLLPSTFPFVLLPSFLVELALASHLLIFRKLSDIRVASAPNEAETKSVPVSQRRSRERLRSAIVR